MEIDIRIGSARVALDPQMMTGSRGLVEVSPSSTVADLTKVVVAACRALGTDEALDLAQVHDRRVRMTAAPTRAGEHLRERVARWLYVRDGGRESAWDQGQVATAAAWLTEADTLLALVATPTGAEPRTDAAVGR